MNIRMDSQEVRVRLEKEEIDTLLNKESLKQDILLPRETLFFQVTFGEQSQITQNENIVTFWLSPDVRDKLKSSSLDKDPIVTIYQEIHGRRIGFKLEVDIFDSKKRKQRI